MAVGGKPHSPLGGAWMCVPGLPQRVLQFTFGYAVNAVYFCHYGLTKRSRYDSKFLQLGEL